jgi:hypothetical protein
LLEWFGKIWRKIQEDDNKGRNIKKNVSKGINNMTNKIKDKLKNVVNQQKMGYTLANEM